MEKSGKYSYFINFAHYRESICRTPLLRIRAFLRLAVMQKKLGNYFENLVTSSYIRYEVLILLYNDVLQPLSSECGKEIQI